MAKKLKPRTVHITKYWWERIKRNPFAFWSSFLGAIITTAAAYGAWDNIVAVADHFRWATPVYARQIARDVPSVVDEKRAVRMVQADHAKALDYLILKDERQALKDAQADAKENPHSTSAPKIIDHLEKSIKERQDRLDKATREGR